VFGIVLLAIGMPSLQYVLEEGNREGWLESPLIVVLSAVAAVTLVTFVVHELEAEQPVVDLRVFASRSYSAGTGLNFLTGFALFSGSYLFSLYCGTVMRYSALEVGKVFLVAGTASMVMMPIIGRIGNKIDGRILLVIGIVIVTLSQVTASHLTAQAGFWDLVKPNMIRSAGLGFVFIPVSVLALSEVPAAQRGNATGLFNLTRELGGSVGTALMGMLVTNGIKRNGSYLAEHVVPGNPVVEEQLTAAARTLGTQTVTRDLVGESVMKMRVTREAMVLSFDQSFRVVACSIALGLVLVLLLRKPKGPVDVAGAH
jgi:DHA2 family multidrug resistance protein